ncbi:MAG: N-acetylmuramoyl-L-alanine amidase [Gammaproteobacteria bacterium]|nr:MAG: N-acetylmuramoyl-L-alanine amidase [Gammaproteobacteria bacterium]
MIVARSSLRIVLLLIGLIPAMGQASSVSVKNLRMWQAPDHTRLVFDLSGPLEHRLFSLSNPERIVIDMKKARWDGVLPALDYSGPLLARVRTGGQDKDNLRVVLDLKQSTRPRTFVLTPYGQYGHRLVIDLYFKKAEDAASKKPAKTEATSKGSVDKKKIIVIAVDAGHGGDDPGAIGRRYRTREKHVVLAIAREVTRRINREAGMRAFLTRKGDYFISLRRRTRIARNHGADIFISIHADYIPGRRGRRVRGSSVYALSQRGATSETARLLANKENASDLIGGSFADKDDILAKVLIDLSQTATIAASIRMGKDMLGTLRSAGPLHKYSVAQAGFTVLKSPAVPSILIETTFISNPGEERKLRSRSFQKRISVSIVNGLRRYIARGSIQKYRRHVVAKSRSPIVATRDHQPRYHMIKRGDTLSGIARRYKVNIDAIRFANNMPNSKLIIGRRLQIP